MEQLHTIRRSLTTLVNLSSDAPVSRWIARHAHDSPYPQLFWTQRGPQSRSAERDPMVSRSRIAGAAEEDAR